MQIPTIATDITPADRRALGRAVTQLEKGGARATALRLEAAARVGKAHVIGITGPPGAGKSTLISHLLEELSRRGQKVAVIAVDPSSPFTGGAVLGDRFRMVKSQDDERIFIRSLASRGHLGGLSIATGDVIDLFDAAGFDSIIVETVGSGQSEVEITQYADTRLVICPPGLGDGIQAIKAGQMEIADIFVVTKGDLDGAKKTAAELRAMLALRQTESALPPVTVVSAISDQGIPGLVNLLEARTERNSRNPRTADSAVDALLRKYLAGDSYAASLGMELISASEAAVELRMPVQSRHMNFNGKCHGGAIFSLGDMALGLACNAHGSLSVLIDSQMSILRAVAAGDTLHARAIEVSRTKRIGNYQVTITRESDAEHIAMVNGTVYRLERPPLLDTVAPPESAASDGTPTTEASD